MSQTPSENALFSVHVVGDTSGKTWTGDFEAKRKLAKIDQLKQDNYFRFYIGDSSPQFASPAAQSIAEVLSQLRVRLVKFPPWWTEEGFGERIEDDNLLKELYSKTMEAEREHLASLKAKVADAQNELRNLGTLGDGKA